MKKDMYTSGLEMGCLSMAADQSTAGEGSEMDQSVFDPTFFPQF